jgi:alkane 1-monooxygenase
VGKVLGYFNIWIVPALAVGVMGRGFFPFIAVVLAIFVGHPILDRFFRFRIPSTSHWLARVPLYSALPLQVAVLVAAFLFGARDATSAVISGVLCGISGGIMSMCAAHELIHRKNRMENQVGRSLLTVLGYPHFYLEHFHHHATVATPDDIATAWRRESLYQFWFRSIVAGWRVSWELHPKKMARIVMTQAVLLGAIAFAGGPLWALVWFTQAVVSILLLKWVDYLEHYGLLRARVGDRYEAVSTKHSWDSTRTLTNWYLYNLGYHSQHHLAPHVRYDELPTRSQEWHEHPHGYSTMMLLALIPALWRRTLHPVLDAEKVVPLAGAYLRPLRGERKSHAEIS